MLLTLSIRQVIVMFLQPITCRVETFAMLTPAVIAKDRPMGSLLRRSCPRPRVPGRARRDRPLK